ncbi:MAG: SDR family NAD(P)-dependent oxidoreductase [Alphaproteobacteria bacterium]
MTGPAALPRRLAGRTALVTGGSQGIGAAICRRFAAEGAEVGVVASASLAKADAVAGAIRAAGGKARAFTCDVAQVAEIERLVAEATAALGRIDILVNCAGLFFPTRLGETDEAMWDRLCDVNLKATFFACNAVAPAMKARGSGKIVNFASGAGLAGRSNYLVYAAVKAGVVNLTRSLGAALAPHGVNANCIAPGNTETPMNENVRTGAEYAAIRDAIRLRTPSSRLFSDPDEIAAGAAFLASDEARAMHGAVLVMDEGVLAGY